MGCSDSQELMDQERKTQNCPVSCCWRGYKVVMDAEQLISLCFAGKRGCFELKSIIFLFLKAFCGGSGHSGTTNLCVCPPECDKTQSTFIQNQVKRFCLLQGFIRLDMSEFQERHEVSKRAAKGCSFHFNGSHMQVLCRPSFPSIPSLAWAVLSISPLPLNTK